MKTVRTLIVATYLDVTGADADCEALRSVQTNPAAHRRLDAVIITRRRSGQMRFYREPENGRSVADGAGPTWSLSAGLAAALFPSVGADLPPSRFVQRQILNAAAGVVSDALGRTSLHELGTFLDESGAGLIVAIDATEARPVGEALRMAQSSMSISVAAIDVDGLEKEVHRLAAQARPRGAF